MYTEFVAFLRMLKPDDGDKFLMMLGGWLGFWFSFAVGGVDKMIIWLAILAVGDYVTGIIAAFRTCKWCSSVGFKGIAKKAAMFAIVALCHGLDQTTGLDMFRNMAIFAYAVNEAGSIIENIDASGWGKFIPAFLRNGLKQIQDKHKI